MTLAISTVCSSIADLHIVGVKICDLSNVPPAGKRILPILFPDPDNPISNFTNERMSQGGGSSALEDVEYDLNYMFIYSELGAGRTGLDYLEKCVEQVQEILDAIIGIDTITGAVDIMPYPFNIQVIQDPSGKNYIGCTLVFHVKEFWR